MHEWWRRGWKTEGSTSKYIVDKDTAKIVCFNDKFKKRQSKIIKKRCEWNINKTKDLLPGHSHTSSYISLRRKSGTQWDKIKGKLKMDFWEVSLFSSFPNSSFLVLFSRGTLTPPPFDSISILFRTKEGHWEPVEKEIGKTRAHQNSNYLSPLFRRK